MIWQKYTYVPFILQNLFKKSENASEILHLAECKQLMFDKLSRGEMFVPGQTERADHIEIL